MKLNYKSIWNQFERNLKWIYKEKFHFDLNLKRSWNRFENEFKSIYKIRFKRKSTKYIYLMAWIERAAPRQFANFDHWLWIDVTGDRTVGFPWNQNRWVRIEKSFPMIIRNLKSNGWIWNYVQIKFGKGRCKCSSVAVIENRLYGPW